MKTSGSFSTTHGKNYNINESFHNEINVFIKDKNAFEFKYSDTKNVILDPNNIYNFNNSISIREPNTNTNIYKIHGSENNTEHPGLTTEDTLRCNILKFQETHQEIICQDYLKDEIVEVSSIVSESGDTLILCEESDIDTDETKEISQTSASGSVLPILKEISNNNENVFSESLYEISNVCSKIEKKDNLILSEKIALPDENHLNNKNDHTNAKLDESFVSEYEISLLIDDSVSILSEESLDSEYEISLLEDDLNDQEIENESSNREYKVSLLEDDINKEGDQNDIDKNKSDLNTSLKCLPNVDEGDEKIASNSQRQTSGYENDQTTTIDNVSLCENEVVIEKIIVASNNDLDVKKEMQIMSKTNDQTTNNNVNLRGKEADEIIFERIIIVNSNVSDLKKEMQTISKTKSRKNSNDETGHFTPLTEGKTILKLEQSGTSRSEHNAIDNILIKGESTKNNKCSQYSLKHEKNNESQNQNKLKFNGIEIKSSEEKSITVSSDECVGRSCVKTVIVEKISTELDVSKNANNKLQLSNKEITNKMERFRENALIIDTNKQPTENTSTVKANGEKTVKTDSVASASSDSKQDIENVIPDYYEEEKEDLINPGWNKIKELSTDEERYRQVRDCWKSKSIPNPFKNLTYYSYRKKVNFGKNNARATRQHKRHASNNLPGNNAKRTRTCTYIFDDRIKCIEKEKEMKAQKIQNKMYDEVDRLNKQCLQKEMKLQNFNGYNFNPRMQQFELNGLRREFQERISCVRAEYKQKVFNCRDQYTSELNSLKNNRNEVLQFYSFYKGLSINENKDPTVLTNAQMQELEEIENIYNQMDYHYR